jgi:protein-export membrane protein SecD
MTILVNGEVLMSKVSVSDTISGGNATISNSSGYTYSEAYELATSLQAGTFGVDLSVREQSILGPTLGENAIRDGLIAGAIGLVLIMIFMGIFYRKLGILASVALCIYVELLLIFCSILPWVQLTLPGIAGLVLGIGMAVDANIVIFERTKDEYRKGKSLISALDIGFKKGRIAVIDANITTIIGAIVLWVFGGSSIVGFAITLLISIVISMFTALVVTRGLIKLALPFESIEGSTYGLKREVAKDVK